MTLRGLMPALWVVLAGVAAALHVGKLSPALPVLRDALGVSLMQAGFLLSLVQLAGMTLGLAVGLAVGLAADGLGLRRCVLAGLLILFGASALGGFAPDAASLLLLRGVESFGFLLVAMPGPSLIRHLVSSQRLSTVLGLWGTYMPLGTALALLLGPWVMGYWDWSGWWWALAGVTLLVAAGVTWGVPSDAQRVAACQDQVPPEPQMSWQQRLQLTLSSGGPWLIAGSFAVYSGQWLAVIGFLPSIYAQAGIPGAGVALLTACVAAVNMVGNLAAGHLQARGVSAYALLVWGFSVMGVSTFAAFATLLWGVDGASLPPLLRYVAVLLFSMIGGLIPGTLFVLAVRLAPSEHTVSTTVGWMQQWSALGQFVGPPLVALVASRAGGWHLTWVVTGLCSITGLLLAWRLRRRWPQAVALKLA